MTPRTSSTTSTRKKPDQAAPASSTLAASTSSPVDFTGFNERDFEVFEIDGLEPRMEALIDRVRPKLHLLGDLLSPYLSELCKEQMYPHVARHARRTVNPPHDTWVAFANSKRGYKAYPHFQIGLWSTHLFIQFAIIYESTHKNAFAQRAIAELGSVRSSIPDNFVWSKDHMVPTGSIHSKLSDEELSELFLRLRTVKAAELTCGIHIQKGDPLLSNGEQIIDLVKETFQTLLPLYRMASN